MTTEEIETMLKDMAQELLEFKPTLKRLGLDEIVPLKVLIDLDKSKLVAILQNGHKKKYRNSDLGSIRANRRSEH